MLNTIPEERSSLILKSFIQSVLAVLGALHFAGFSLAVESRGCSLAVVPEPLIAVAALVVGHGL
jgi:hypothetical protein